MSMITRLLIANRGEIACRVIKTAKRLGIHTVAVYSDIEKYSKHVQMADSAFHLGANPSTHSYLNSEKVLEVALHARVEALHPGFGFLSENADFADRCEKNNLIFIGPPSSAMRKMGSKSEAKKIMTAAKVPVVPGYHGDNQEDEALFQEAKKIGFPVMIKAVMGGGGKGMRIVRTEDEFMDSLASSRRESLKSFKDDKVLVEKYIERPRHIEIQVFGDKFGNYVHLYERDCSFQRRHQKVVEEAPSNIDRALIEQIGQSAVDAAKAVGYFNAGTVEFIFDTDTNKYYFMEMNTRLQVEHPITEMITGLDLVEWQLMVASGQRLPKTQKDIKISGHSLEARIYSEDPYVNFLPTTGTLKYFKEPKPEAGVRIDSGVREKDSISIYYDPMIAKLVTWGKNREEAITKLHDALAQYRIVGLPNNIKFLKNVCLNKDFLKGGFDTSFIEKHQAELLQKSKTIGKHDLLTCALGQIVMESDLAQNVMPADFYNFRVNYNLKKKITIAIKSSHLDIPEKYDVEVELLPSHVYTVVIRESGKEEIIAKYNDVVVKMDYVNKILRIENSEEIFSKALFFEDNCFHTFDENGDAIHIECLSNLLPEVALVEQSSVNLVKSPMPGNLIKVNVKVGDVVKKGGMLCIVEAMKMEHVIKAPENIKIQKVNFREGMFVEAGKNLVEFEKI